MWNTTGFGGDFDGGYSGSNGTAAGGGGGFMNTSQFNSPAGAAKKERRTQNIVSTTVKSINDCEEDSYTLEGMEVHMVSIVGIIRTVEISSTKINYTIDDHTGIIGVLRYPDDEGDESLHREALAEGVYARVCGPVRSHMEKKHVIGFKVMQIDDPNFITTHILEVIQQRLKLKKLKDSSTAVSSALIGGSGAVLANSSLQNLPSVNSGHGSEKDLVLAAIKSANSEIGMSRDTIKKVLEGKLSASAIERIVEELSSDGMIYTTHDDDHFQIIN